MGGRGGGEPYAQGTRRLKASELHLSPDVSQVEDVLTPPLGPQVLPKACPAHDRHVLTAPPVERPVLEGGLSEDSLEVVSLVCAELSMRSFVWGASCCVVMPDVIVVFGVLEGGTGVVSELEPSVMGAGRA